jgi:hypothetical protein
MRAFVKTLVGDAWNLAVVGISWPPRSLRCLVATRALPPL